MDTNNIMLLSEIMINAHYIEDKNDEIILDSNNRIITRNEFITNNRINGTQSFSISRINLQQRLIELGIENPLQRNTADNLENKIKNIISVWTEIKYFSMKLGYTGLILK